MLTDELQVNNGCGERFPEAFHSLTWVGNYNHRVSTFLRCPACGRYFNWIVCPDIYGFGNVGEQRLTRLTGRASRLLNKILSLHPDYYPDRSDAHYPASAGVNDIDPIDVEENFDAVPFNLLLQALKYRIAAAPRILGPFVPKLISFLAKHPDYSDPLGLREMLKNYASSKPERSEAIVEAFLSLKAEEYSTFTDILRHCLTIAGKKN